MMIILISACVFLCLVFLFLIRFLNEVWWNPIRVQRALRAGGIKGPSYNFLHGNSKEIVKIGKEAMATSLELSDHQVLYKVQPHYYLWAKQHGKNYLQWLGPRPQLIITDTHLAKEILYNQELYPKPEFESYVKRMFGDGLVTTKGDKWTSQRKLANHAFHGDNLKGMIPAMISSLDIMLERWRKNEGKEIEVYQEFKLLTSEIISRTAFSSNYLEGQRTFDMLGKLAFLLFKNNYKIRLPIIKDLFKTEDEIEAEKLEQGMKECILKMVKKREEETNGNTESYGNDYLGVLMKKNREADEKISIQDIVDECKTFYIAGHETTTSALTWTMFLLSIHTDWQHKARSEVLHLFGTSTPTSDDIPKLKIMSMIVNETLRLYAPITNLVRQVEKGCRFGKLQAPSRMDVLIPPLSIHHDPEIWGKDAHMFKPERFAEGVAKATNNNIAAFVPFGLGPRNCVGMNFAMAETKLALSMILQRYTFSLSPNYVHSPVVIIGICPMNGLRINFQPL
ncbi:cytochrome P450 CYP749A22-like isoform X1 [Euphorbia lathyris]|uniref:cytochrome P450 CYP749A22-like isoform X1 n=2 Tax=Euphorbia lathyris TaxID=212925 RepID=UPI003313204B